MTNSPCTRYLPNILSFLCCPPLMFPSPLKFKRQMGHTKNMNFFWPTFIWLDPLSANTGCFWLIHLDSGTITNEQGNRVSDTCFQQSGSGRRTWWWESFYSVTSFFEFWEITALWTLFSLGFALTFEEEMYLSMSQSCKTPLHFDLFLIIRDVWRKKSLRLSAVWFHQQILTLWSRGMIVREHRE